MMGSWHWDAGFGWWGWLLMTLFWILIIVGVVLVVRSLSGGSRPSGSERGEGPWAQQPTRSSALDILEERYARGEVDREEFAARKKDLGG